MRVLQLCVDQKFGGLAYEQQGEFVSLANISIIYCCVYETKFYLIDKLQKSGGLTMTESTHSWSGISFEDLTQPQKDFLKIILQEPDKSCFLKGCAGSGKTVIAAHALTLLKKNSSKSTGFLVYTKLLRKFVKDGFKNESIGDEILHFHDWYYKKGHPSRDIFLIDECQDFKPEWIDAVRENSSCQIWLGDDSQHIYEDANGFQKLSQEFSGSSTTELNVNYRNCLFVARFASKFIRLTDSDRKIGLTLQQKVDNFITPILNNPFQASGANNQPVVFIEALDKNQEMDAIARIIKDIQTNTKEYSRKIAVAHFTYRTLDPLSEQLTKRGISIFKIPHHRERTLENLPDFTQNNLVLVSTIHNLKGLEVDYIIFPRTEEDRWDDDQIFNNLLFVLFTRARKRIYCSYVRRQESYIYQAVTGDGNSDFYQFISANEVLGKGNPEKPVEEIEEIIKKHFDKFNI